MDSYTEEKLSLAAGELKGTPNRKKLQHVIGRTLVAVFEKDIPEDLRSKFTEIRSVLLRQGKISDTTVTNLSDEEFRQVWRGLQELCNEVERRG